jgi:hypothetical protein
MGNSKSARVFNGCFIILLILSIHSLSLAQSIEIKLNIPVQNPFEDKIPFADIDVGTDRDFQEADVERISGTGGNKINLEKALFETAKTDESIKVENELRPQTRNAKKENAETAADDEPLPELEKDKFHWKPALIQSGIFLGIQHGFRLKQEKTYTRLGGPFFRDWGRSIKGLRGWKDGDSIFVNYVAHPLQGGFTGRIFINNSDKSKRQEFGKSKEYWKSRMKAMAWSAFWSTQFEIGPISEASIGNVGKFEKDGHSTMAWGDLIITPVAGTGVVIGEDMLDKYVLKNWLERKSGDRLTTKIKIWRSLLTPTLSLSNLLRGKPPWKRDNRGFTRIAADKITETGVYPR